MLTFVDNISKLLDFRQVATDAIQAIMFQTCTEAHSNSCFNKSPAASHSEHRFLAPSSKLFQIWLHHWKGTLYLRAAVHRRGRHPPKGLGTNMTVEAA